MVADQTTNGSESGTSFRQALHAMECGFNLHDTMIWNKGECSFPDSNRYLGCFEFMFVWSKGQPKTVNFLCDRPNTWAGTKAHGTWRQKNGDTIQRPIGQTYAEFGRRFNIWSLPSEKRNTTGHPAVFPLRLAKDHIVSWSNEGDTVFDPFLGSGTTRIAAYDMRRNFMGCEISKDYFDAQERRFAEHTAQTRMEL